MADKEMVLQLGVEGGGATVFRKPVGAGDFEFYVDGSSMDLDENDDEVWRSWESQPYLRIEDAVRSISNDGSWVLFHPISIHPDYRTSVWELVQETARTLPDELNHLWDDRRRTKWQHLCHEQETEGLPSITAKQIDALLPFLDRFETTGFSAGSWKMPDGQFPWYSFEDVVMEFQQALYDNGWVTPAFNWTEWQQSAQEFVDSPQKIEQADATTIQKLLTTHVRADRFCEGHLASMFENGHVVALMRRLKTIRGTMPQ
ncbi:DUF6508 domain-containing protein [Frigoriglobus tundricola]|uniref:Uncharacterized protein n=1 Tax=Frigoriglobus tundricola TaxID=2774151 RepID=A0A6M5Z533_9BACT|nr:DUF6508 domain-containing protein [Frigoriglobus tundricola]QJX01176.1 hypothetical protein FTUN_8815 [Frigoriglobus tundricola]